MRLKYTYHTQVAFSHGVGQHNMLLRCMPAYTACQQPCIQELSLPEHFWCRESTDAFGNRIVTAGTSLHHTSVEYMSSGVVESSIYCIPDAEPHPMYLQPSALTHASASMSTMLPDAEGNLLERCLGLTHLVHDHIVYTPGITNMLTTATDVYTHRKGVCQDYTHLMVALCRQAGIPARYVCGLMVGEGQTHAWVEVHDGLCWYAFDPTNDTAAATGYIKLAHGRDALDCPVSRGMYHGTTKETTQVSVTVKEI